MTKKELEQELKQLKEQFKYYYNANKQKKEDNERLRLELNSLKREQAILMEILFERNKLWKKK